MINLIIDANNLLHRCKNVLSREIGNLETAHEEGIFMRKLATDFFYTVKLFPSANMVIWAQDNSSWRKQVKIEDGGYKANREPDTKFNWKKFYQIAEDFGKIIEKNGGIYSSIKYAEADDLAMLWANHFFNNGENCIVISADRDMKQLPKWNGNNWLLVFDPSSKNKKLISPSNFKENYFNEVEDVNLFNFGSSFNSNRDKEVLKDLISKGELIEIDTKEFLFTKILHGDKGDNVPSVYSYIKNEREYKVSENKALSYYDEFKKCSMMDIYEDIDIRNKIAERIKDGFKNIKDIDAKYLPNINTISDNIKRNITLMYLNINIIPDYLKESFENYNVELSKGKKKIFNKNLNRITLLDGTAYAKEEKKQSGGWSLWGGIDINLPEIE